MTTLFSSAVGRSRHTEVHVLNIGHSLLTVTPIILVYPPQTTRRFKLLELRETREGISSWVAQCQVDGRIAILEETN